MVNCSDYVSSQLFHRFLFLLLVLISEIKDLFSMKSKGMILNVTTKISFFNIIGLNVLVF